jgi:hypothetical protein
VSLLQIHCLLVLSDDAVRIRTPKRWVVSPRRNVDKDWAEVTFPCKFFQIWGLATEKAWPPRVGNLLHWWYHQTINIGGMVASRPDPRSACDTHKGSYIIIGIAVRSRGWPCMPVRAILCSRFVHENVCSQWSCRRLSKYRPISRPHTHIRIHVHISLTQNFEQKTLFIGLILHEVFSGSIIIAKSIIMCRGELTNLLSPVSACDVSDKRWSWQEWLPVIILFLNRCYIDDLSTLGKLSVQTLISLYFITVQ